jgi:valyl-tRNA synthetase
MAMAGFEWRGEKPFNHVYFTGMVRDKQRRKMSKQLGNSPDALKLIEDFGADGVRFGMLSSSPAGGDLLFDEKLVEQGRNFCNKIWNAKNFIKGLNVSETMEPGKMQLLASQWISDKFEIIAKEVNEDIMQYRLSESLTKIYSFIWTDYCSWYIEMIKPSMNESIDKKTYHAAIEILKKICSLLHPFMPFITEEVWHQVSENKEKTDCILSAYPQGTSIDSEVLKAIEHGKKVITSVREVRSKNGMKSRDELPLCCKKTSTTAQFMNLEGYCDLISKMAVLSKFEITDKESKGIGFIVDADQYTVEVELKIDTAKEIEEKQKELDHQIKFVASIESKLSNEKFVNSAPEKVIELEKKKLHDGQERTRILKEEIERLKAGS